MKTFSVDDFEEMREYFISGATKDYAFRKQQLKLLKNAIKKYEDALSEALFKDLHKSVEESFTTEIGFIYAEISHALSHLKSWMEPVSVSSPLIVFPSSSKIVRDALGVCLIIAPWNYPFQLLFGPLVGAIAGGNCAVLKPSEFTTHTSAVIEQMMDEFFDKKYLCVVQGPGHTIVPQMMNDNRFDHVFFTGSTAVGKEIAMLAAHKLVPVTLELGGKSPCVVDEDADIKVAATRIAWGKFTNAGQTCVAPDYLLVHENIKDELMKRMIESIHHFYGDDPKQSRDYGRIINEQRFNKLEGFIKDGNVIAGGMADKDALYIAPTIMDNVSLQSTAMRDEIFGPILPVFTFNKHDEAFAMINKNANPLSLYFFGSNSKTAQSYINKVPFGGGCINNTLVHLANAQLPFGGVGSSGVGAYHGKFSFDTFTRLKSILKTSTLFDPIVKYPPYKGKLNVLRWFFK